LFRRTVVQARPRPLRRRVGDRCLLGGRRARHRDRPPHLRTVGLPQGAVKEGRERVYAAIANSGYTFPAKRIAG